jgi:hypothetical protein
MGAPKPIKSGTFKEQYERERQAEIDAVIAEFGGDTDAPTALTGMAQALLIIDIACHRSSEHNSRA